MSYHSEIPLHTHYDDCYKKAGNDKHWWGCGVIGTPVHRWLECKMMQLLWEKKGGTSSKESNIGWPTNSTPGCMPKELEAETQTDYLYTNVYNSIVHNSRQVEIIQYPSVDEQINKMCLCIQCNMIQH